MSDKQKQPTETELDEIISRVYDVALDPTRYEDLLDEWENTLAPLRGSDGDDLIMVEQRIADHFERANTVLDRVGSETKQNEMDEILSHLENVAAIVISEDLKIVGINEAATNLLGAEQGQSISKLVLDEQDKPAVTRQIARMIGDAKIANSVLRVRSKDEGRFVIFHMRRAVLWDGSPAVIAVTSVLRWPEGFGDVLEKAFGLTRAETGVVRLLIECCSAKEIAHTRGRSIDTVRAQIKAILAKTETRNQIELVRVTLSMMDIAITSSNALSEPRLLSRGMEKLEPLSFKTIYEENGRALDYLILGDPNGKPLLYFHMKYGFVRWTASAEEALKNLGIKAIVPVRAGFGNSDPMPKGAIFSQCMAKDTLCILKAEKVTQCPVITQSSDHLIALEVERMLPGTIKAIIAVAAMYPFSRSEQVERMHKYHRFIHAGAKYTPHLLPFMVKAGFHLARRGGKTAFVHSVFGQSEADIETFEEPEVFEAMIMGSEVCLSETHSAHAAFTHQTLSDYRKDKIELMKWSEGKMPFHSLNGMQDPGVHKDTVAENVQDYPWIDFKLYEDAGELLFFKYWPDAISLAQKYL